MAAQAAFLHVANDWMHRLAVAAHSSQLHGQRRLVSLRVKVSELGRISAEVSKDAHFFSKRWLGGVQQLLGRAETT